MPAAREHTVDLLDLWYLTDTGGWVGAIEATPESATGRIALGGQASPALLDLSDDTADGWRPFEVEAIHWFHYPAHVVQLAAWIDARHWNCVWLTSYAHPTRAIIGAHREGDPRAVVAKGWRPRCIGRNIRLVIAYRSLVCSGRGRHG